MANLKFKDFTWPNDPEVYREVTTREPQYTTQDGTSTYTGMGYLHRTITGSGAFLGQRACADMKTLVDLAEQTTPGYLIHPIWGSRYCYLTKLEIEQDSQSDLVRYSFAFTEAHSDGTIPK